jgi:hypothetical protein
MKIVSKRFYLGLTSIPLLSIALFYSFVLRAYLVLGRFPTPYNPDPAELHSVIHVVLAFLGLVLPFAACWPWLGVTIFSFAKKSFSQKFLVVCSIFYVVSLIVWFILIKTDPGNFMEWFFD